MAFAKVYIFINSIIITHTKKGKNSRPRPKMRRGRPAIKKPYSTKRVFSFIGDGVLLTLQETLRKGYRIEPPSLGLFARLGGRVRSIKCSDDAYQWELSRYSHCHARRLHPITLPLDRQRRQWCDSQLSSLLCAASTAYDLQMSFSSEPPDQRRLGNIVAIITYRTWNQDQYPKRLKYGCKHPWNLHRLSDLRQQPRRRLLA